MRFSIRSVSRIGPALLALLPIAAAGVALQPSSAAGVGDVAAGKRLYLDGLLASGKPVQAVVQGDVAVSGAQFSCVACHGRSGMGSVEGRKLAPPVTPVFLMAPRVFGSRTRPAYTRQTLARAIREGIDPGGKRLDPLMPRYRIGRGDMAALVAYLAELSAHPSPGAGADEIHFATVVTPDAPRARRDAMLSVAKTFLRAKNGGSRSNRKWHKSSWPEYYGEWVLHVWEVEGPPHTWEQQLDARYRERPVFAFVSGAGGSEWGPIHRFCESRHIPCLLPNVDTPPEAGEDYYSLYFSRGVVLEARAVAAHVARAGTGRVLQVFRREETGIRAARTLADALRAEGRETIEMALGENDPLTASLLGQRAREQGATAVVLWLQPAHVAALGKHASELARFEIYVSATLLDGDLSAAAGLSAGNAFLAQPYALPAEARPRFARVSGWLSRERVAVPEQERRIADQTFFAMTVLSEGVEHLKKNFYRDYLLELIDHFSGLDSWSTFYPRLSFGPGQRYLSKGCSLVPLGRADGGAEWIVP